MQPPPVLIPCPLCKVLMLCTQSTRVVLETLNYAREALSVARISNDASYAQALAGAQQPYIR